MAPPLSRAFFGDERGGEFTPFTFSQAAIKEFQVIRSDYGLEFSAGGAVINAITKSGSNEIHGEVFGFYRDEHFVGADAEGQEADDFRQLQYGFALGGPIVRDRLHFFVSFDQQDFDEPTLREFEYFPSRPGIRMGGSHRPRLGGRDRVVDGGQRRQGGTAQTRLATRVEPPC